MAFVNVPKDLTKVKSKLAFNLTKRQLICFGIAIAIGIPIYFSTREPIGNTAAVLLMMAVMFPFFMLAMFERDGMPAEKLLRNYIRTKIYYPSTRPYQTDNLYKQIERTGDNIAQDKETAKSRKKVSSKYPKRKRQ